MQLLEILHKHKSLLPHPLTGPEHKHANPTRLSTAAEEVYDETLKTHTHIA